MALLEHALALVGVEAKESEHADLLENVIPVTWCLELLCQELEEALAHGDDTTCHLLDILLPLCKERRICEDHLDDTSTKRGWVGDFGTLNGSKLREDRCVLLGCRGHDVERTDSFAVQAGVLGETLTDQEWDALAGDKVSHRPSISIEITRGETLVSAVEECKVTLLNENVGNLLPLLLSRINAGRVVCAGV